MKKLFVFVPVLILALFLLNSFVLKEKEAILKSTDGGKTWQDISKGLPETERSINFYAGASDLYLNVKNEVYHSKANLKTPVWEKEQIPDVQSADSRPLTSIVFNRSGVMAYNFEGQIYQKTPATETWLPIHTNFKKNTMRTIFETADGTVLLGLGHGLYKSTDKGENWRKVKHDGGVTNMVESEGVLIATGTKGIMRSTDNGENWQWVIREGGFGMAVERIEGGFAAIDYNTTTKSRRVHISLDGGRTWKAISDGLPPSPSISSIKQMGKYLVCGHPDGIFRSSDMGKTWTSVHPGFDNADHNGFEFVLPWDKPSNEPNKVFKIHSSGNALYAVAVSAGC
ncbi:MAG: exo-alpha-sialidase [Bacteroidota bacterium]